MISKKGQSNRLTIDDYTFTKNVIWSVIDTGIATITNKAVEEGLTLANSKDNQGNVFGYIHIRIKTKKLINYDCALKKQANMVYMHAAINWSY